MRKYLLMLILGHAVAVFGQDAWTSISPLNYCPEFKIQYKALDDGNYLVKIPRKSVFGPIHKTVKDINDLSQLSDILVSSSVQKCSEGRTLIRIENDALYFEEGTKYESLICKQPIDYSQPYVDFTKDMVDLLQNSGDSCDQLMAYTHLQTKIKQLRNEDLIKFDRTGNILQRALQLITGGETDKLIDMFNGCGGKKNSEQFIANIILLEAQNACIMPSPPGLLSYEKTREIALDIAAEYKNTSLVKLGTKQEEITKKAMLTFIDVILKDEIEKLIPGQIEDLDEFIANLDTVKQFKKSKIGKLHKDYLGLVFTFDATMEIAQKAVPLLAKSSLQDKLPSSWNEIQRLEFFDTDISPLVDESYEACMDDYFKASAFGDSTNKKIEKRNELKQSYCSKYPEDCNAQSCESKANMLSQRQDISDTQVVQGCAMKAIMAGIKPLIKASINDQREAFKNMFTLSDEAVEGMTNETWEDLVQCANRKIAKGPDARADFIDPNDSPLLKNLEHMQKTNASDFEDVIIQCANVAEIGVSKDFFVKTLLNESLLAEQFPSDEKIEFAGKSYPKALKQKVDEILVKGYDKCIFTQNFYQSTIAENESFNRNPLLCMPAVEILASKEVVRDLLNDLYKDVGVENSPEALLSLKQLDNCTEDSVKSSLDKIGLSEGKIENAKDAQDYLEKNNEFYSCVKTSINDVVDIYGGKFFDKEIDELRGQLQDPGFVIGLKDNALEQAKQCFKDELSKSSNWREFLKYNADDGIKNAETKCAAAALDYILPKAMIRETALQLDPLEKEGLIKGKTEVGNILAATAFLLRDKYNLSPPASVSGDNLIEWSFAQAHNAHTKLEGNSTNTFVDEYTSFAMNKAIKTIHKNIKEDAAPLIGAKATEDVFKVLSPSCLEKGFNKYQDELNQLIKDVDNAPAFQDKPSSGPLLGQISKIIRDSVRYIRELGPTEYNNRLKSLEKVCENFDSYQNPREIADTGAIDFVLKGILEGTLAKAFLNIAKDQCIDDLKARIPSQLHNEVIKACEETDPIKMTSAFSFLMTTHPVAQNEDLLKEMSFIQERQFDMILLVEKKIHDPKFLEEVLFNDPNREIMNYIYDNFTPVVTEDKDVMVNLTKIVAEKLFKDQSPGSFADEFGKAQLINGLGLSGYARAKAAVTEDVIGESISWLQDIFVSKKKAVKIGKEGLAKDWTPRKIKEIMDWNGIDSNQRNFLLNSLYINAVEPTLSGGVGNMDSIEDDLSEHAESYQYKSDNKTFEGRITDRITDYIMDNKTRILGI